MFSTDKMIDNMRSRCIATSVAEPLPADVAHNHARRLMDTAVFTRMFRQIAVIIRFFFLLFELQLGETLGCSRNLQVQRRATVRSINLDDNAFT